MLEASRVELDRRVDASATVLHVAGSGGALPRANWVISPLPHEPGATQIAPERWIQRDICDNARWPFDDDQFDFVVCAQVLQNVRDPVWVCQELTRVARAGYIEVPSRIEEQTYGLCGDFAGWSEHRWLIDVGANAIQFVHKTHELHGEPRYWFDRQFARALPAERRVQTFWWDGGFDFGERIFYSSEEYDTYLAGYVDEVAPPRRRARIPRVLSDLRQIVR